MKEFGSGIAHSNVMDNNLHSKVEKRAGHSPSARRWQIAKDYLLENIVIREHVVQVKG